MKGESCEDLPDTRNLDKQPEPQSKLKRLKRKTSEIKENKEIDLRQRYLDSVIKACKYNK